MAKSNLYAAIAGYVGRPDQTGLSGVFARQAGSDRWDNPVAGCEAYCVNVHPAKPEVVFAGTSNGVYRSTDRGKTFQRANFPDSGIQIWSFLVDATDRNVIYAGGSPITMYRSENCGETWKRLPDPNMPDRAVMPFACRVMRMTQHPAEPGTIYAALEVNGVMKTTNFAESWTDCSTDLIRLAQQPHLKSKIVSDTYNEGMLDGHAIAISPADPDKVIVAVRMGLFETVDAGETWTDMDLGRFSPTTYGRDIRVSPQNGNVMYSALSVAAASKDGGLYRTTDKGATWSRFDKVQVHGTIMSVALHQTDPDQVFLGARYDGEIYGTEDGGATWQAHTMPAGVKDIYCLAVG
jgi:photosystem II stability/assembly factor-like uncharacterized protein